MILFSYILIFIFGMAAGAGLLWLYLCRLWKRDAYAFRTIIDGVIELRKKREAKP